MAEATSNVFVRLPDELRQAIFGFCDSSTVLNLSLTSQATFNVCISHLAHTIDLSVHNGDHWGIHRYYINVNVPPDHVKRSLTNRDVSVVQRQRKLIALLDRDPHLASGTRVLRWTMMDSDQRSTKRMSQASFNYGEAMLWDTFKHFSNITEVDIAFMTNWREFDEVPRSLFSTAISVSLAGIASHALIASIINSIDPSKLRHLRLNNLQTFAEPQSTLLQLSEDEIRSHRCDRPGAVQGYLEPLIGRCPALRSLHILTTAEFVEQTLNLRPSPIWSLECEAEHRRYAEIGGFVDSVKSTLREFVFEHGPDVDYFGNSPGVHSERAFASSNLDNPLPMDYYFDTYILPVFWTGSWPKLERIIVRGIGHWKPIDAWKQDGMATELRWLHRKTTGFRERAITIWDAVDGSNIDIVIEDEASRPFYRRQNDRTMSWTG
ncbi:hypothetical protein BDV96DRAFT_47887 [Lophiotrema nucula]|uniref:F-box domain-containing protein n=1 Tax=Lophiotrema nucula TaxID=690887 RepID=A0A6A5ZCY5_9PLEO|nr:hypothetical protein BDV96DRAFT_47887 [Lophiotrema nucula]